MIKKYLCKNHTRYTQLLKFSDGTKKYITYEDTRNGKGCVYVTRVKKVQSAIEASDYFATGRIIIAATYQEDVESETTTEGSTTKTVTTYNKIKNFASAQNILINKYGVAPEEITTVEELLAKAEELGVSFPNLKTT